MGKVSAAVDGILRAARKAEELWGDPVITKASAPGSGFGPGHGFVRVLDADGDVTMVPKNLYAEFKARMDDMYANDRPENLKLQSEMNKYHSAKSTVAYMDLRRLAKMGLDRYPKIEDFPPEVVDAYRRQLHADTMFNFEEIGEPQMGPKEAAAAVERFNRDPGTYLTNMVNWASVMPTETERAVNSAINSMKAKVEGGFETGKPVTARVFHTSPSNEIEQFDNSFLGQNTGANSARLGHFFAGSPMTSNSYSGTRPTDMGQYQRMLGVHPDERSALLSAIDADPGPFVTDPGSTSKPRNLVMDTLRDPSSPLFNEAVFRLESAAKSSGAKLPSLHAPTTYPVMLNMKNPLVRDWEGGDYTEHSYSKFLREAQAAGHDSAILKNTYDGGPNDNIFVTFDPTRIRSMAAAYDPANINKAKLTGNIDPRLLGAMGAGSGLAGMSYLMDNEEPRR